jgi:hypothetical protein
MPERYANEPGLAELWATPATPQASFEDLGAHHAYAHMTFTSKEEALRHLAGDVQIKWAVDNGMVTIVRVGRGETAEYQIWVQNKTP